MQIVLYIISIASSMYLRKKISGGKIAKLAFYVCIFFFIMNSALNIPDAENYNIFYNYVGLLDTSPLYDLVQTPFTRIGVTFPVFKAILYVSFFFLLSVYFRKINVNSFYVFFLMLLSVFFTNAIQIRNFCAMCVLTIGLIFLLKGGKFSRILFLILIVIASLFHSSFIAYTVFLIPLPKKAKFRKYLLMSYFLLFIAAYTILFFNKDVLIDILMLFGSYEKDKISFYSSSITNLGPWIVFIGQIYTIIMFYFCYKRIEHLDTDVASLIENTLFVNILSIPLCGLSLLNLTFYRLIRNIVLINYGVLTVFWNYRRRTRTIDISSALSFSYLILWFIIDAVLLQSFNQIILPFFK